MKAVLSWATIAIAVTLRLILTSHQQMVAIEGARFDDALAFDQAVSIAAGKWLGSYQILTLAKGPFFSVFAALVHLTTLPLISVIHFFHVAAALMMALAIRPLLRSQKLFLLCCLLLLFNPFDLGAALNNRFLRDSMFPALSIVVLSSFILMFVTVSNAKQISPKLAVFAGFLFGCFWLTREEGVWLLPSVALLWTCTCCSTAAVPNRNRWRAGTQMLSPIIGFTIAVTAVGLLNLRYKKFVLVETQTASFKTAYGSLVRLQTEPGVDFVPVSKKTRQLAYQISPTYSLLEPFQEGPVGKSDEETSCRELGICDEIAGGWFIWSFLDSISSAGIATDARTTSNFYERMTNEIDAACRMGAVKCTRNPGSLAPPWRMKFLVPVISGVGSLILASGTFDAGELRTPASSASDLYRDRMARFTHSPVSPSNDNSDVKIWKDDVFDKIKLVYLIGGWIAFIILPLLLTRMILKLRDKTDRNLVIVTLAIILAVLLRCGLFAYINATSYPALTSRYFLPVPTLMITLFCLASSSAARLSVFKDLLRRKVTRTDNR